MGFCLSGLGYVKLCDVGFCYVGLGQVMLGLGQAMLGWVELCWG